MGSKRNGVCSVCAKDGEIAARSLCWPCYQRSRRVHMNPKRVPPCVASRRYHSYGSDDRCTFCGVTRVFAA